MANIFTGSSTLNNALSVDSVNRYSALFDSELSHQSNEAFSTITCRTPGTASNLRAIILFNNRTSSTTLVYRANGADGNQTITIGAGVAGTVEDTTHTDTLADGDAMAVKSTTGAGSAESLAITYIGMSIAVTSGSAKQIAASGSVGSSTASLTQYLPVAGALGQNNSENTARIYAPVALTLSNLQVYVSANARTTTTTYTSRNNGANGNQSVSYTSGQTGLKEDTTNSDSVTAGNHFCAKRVTSTGTGTITTKIVSCKVVTDGVGFPVFAKGTGNTGTDYYTFMSGDLEAGLTEADYAYPVPFNVTATNVTASVSANTSTTDVAVKLRINGADGTGVATITASTSGGFRDTTNSDDVPAGDTLNYSVTGATTGNPVIRAIGMFLTEYANPPSPTSGNFLAFM